MPVSRVQSGKAGSTLLHTCLEIIPIRKKYHATPPRAISLDLTSQDRTFLLWLAFQFARGRAIHRSFRDDYVLLVRLFACSATLVLDHPHKRFVVEKKKSCGPFVWAVNSGVCVSWPFVILPSAL